MRTEGHAMWNFIERTANDAFQMTDQLQREHWIVVFVAALVLGAFLMRGFGQRI